MEPTYLIIFDTKITEPSATFTDLIVSAVCLYAFIKLRQQRTKDKASVFFNWFFITMGIATIFSGILGHAFFTKTTHLIWKLPGWIISMFSISLLERAAIKHVKKHLPPKIALFFEIINITELFAALIITSYELDFYYVKMHTTFGLLAVILPLQIYLYFKISDKSSKFFLTGIGITFLSALVFRNKISAHVWFDYLAVSHMIIAFGVYAFYHAAKHVTSDDYFK